MIALRILLALWKPIAALLGLVAAYWKGRADARAKAKLDRAQDALKTRERIDHAEIEKDPDAARAWLRRHADRLRDDRKP